MTAPDNAKIRQITPPHDCLVVLLRQIVTHDQSFASSAEQNKRHDPSSVIDSESGRIFAMQFSLGCLEQTHKTFYQEVKVIRFVDNMQSPSKMPHPTSVELIPREIIAMNSKRRDRSSMVRAEDS